MSTPFILKFSIPANSNLTITLPINSYNGASIITNIEWDSGVSNTNFTYTYPQNTSSLPIIKTVRITGTIKWFGNGTHSWTGANCLIEVTSFSDNLVSLAGAFNNATQLTIVPTSLPSTVTNMNYMFANATVFNHPIGSWNTSAVTTMSGMFRNAQAFNQPIDSWDTSKVTYMDSMFLDAIAFNQSLNNWNTSAVTTMSGMFQTAIAFNQSLNKWDTSKVTQMEYMFFNASTFNGEINSWNTFAVTIMYNMFMGASTFNQPLNNWNTSNVTTMASMFENASAFNQPLNNWNTSKVTTMSYMFNGASAFNQSINNWNTSVVDNMSYMFQNASAFNQPLDNWNTSNVINMAAMFKNAPAFNQPLNNWNTSNVIYMTAMFQNVPAFNQPLNNWNTSKVTSMAAMFQNASAFNQSINNWNTSKVTEMYSMFQNASAFNQPISNWSKKTSNTNMNSMFQNASAFNQQLSGWTTTTSMFTDATAYNNSLSIPPGIPTNLTATAGNTQVQLSWTKPETAGGLTITYVIQYSSNNGSEWTTFNYLTSSSTSATVTGLTNGTSYIFKVGGTNSRNINYSTTSSSIIPEGPFAPTISTTTSGNTQVSLSWTIPTPSNNGGTDNTDYIIQYSFNNGYTWSSPISTGSTTLNYTVTGLSNGTSYIFKVAAVNNLGTGNYSTNLATVAPSGSFAPTNLYVTPGNSQVDLSWTAPTNNGTIAIIGYNIQYLTGSGSTWSSPISTESTTLNYTVTGLTNGTSYIFQVAAVNSNGTANYSANSSIVIPDVLPVAPTNLTATAGDTQVVLSWTTPINNGGSAITGYNIQYLTGSGTTWSLLSIGSATNSYTVTGLTYGYSYIFRVAAVNSKGTGSYSDQSPVTLATVPGAPTDLTATLGDAQVSLTWSAPTSNGGSDVTGYTIEYSLDNGTWTIINDIITTNYVIFELLNGSQYRIKVKANNSVIANNQNYITIYATPDVIPNAPTILTAIPGNTQVVLSWVAPTSNGGTAIINYIIEYSANNENNWNIFTRTTSLTSTNDTIKGLVNGNSYKFRVFAVNNLGPGFYSNEFISIPDIIPDIPTDLTATPSNNNQVSLAWNAPANNGGSDVTGYTIKYSSDNQITWSSPIETTDNSATITGLTNNNTYIFNVAAVNNFGTGNYISTTIMPSTFSFDNSQTITKTYLDEPFIIQYPSTNDLDNFTYDFTSSNLNLIEITTVDNILEIKVTIKGATTDYGDVVITAKRAATNKYWSGEKTIIIIVNKFNQQLQSFNIDKVVNDNAFTIGQSELKSLTNCADNSTGVFTYEILSNGNTNTNTSVDSTGLITWVNPGIVTLTAEQSADANYEKSSVNFTLTIEKINLSLGIFNLSSESIEYNDKTFEVIIPEITNIFGNDIFTYEFEVLPTEETNEQIATYNSNTSKFDIHSVGSNKIKITRIATNYYSIATTEIDLSIVKSNPTFTLEDILVTFGQNPVNINTPTSLDILATSETFIYTYTINDSIPIATINESNQLVILSAGTTKIHVTRAETKYYSSKEIEVNLKIEKALATFSFSFNNSQTITKTFLVDNIFTIPYPTTTDIGDFTYEFTSSNPNLIEITTVDNNLGIKVTIKGATTDYGDVIITASRTATTNYSFGEKTINIIVGKANTIINNIFINDKTMSNTVFTINEPTSNNPSRNFTYSISNQYSNIATISKNIDESATITMENAGNFIIDVNQDGNKNFNPGSSQININVAKIDADFSNLNFGPIVFAPNLFITINSDNYDNEIGTNIIFTSSNSNIAQIIENIDQVTQIKSTMIEINNAGTTIITAKQESNGIYLEKTISYELNIKKATGDFKFVFDNETNSTNLTKTYLVDNIFTIPYPTTTDIGDFTYEFTSSNPNLIEITTVDNNLGIKVTIKGATTDYGDVIITAKRNNSNNYNELSQSIQLSIEKSTQELKTITIDKEINIESLNLTQIWLRENLNNVSTRLFNLSLVNTQSTIVTISNSNDNSFTIGLNSIGQVKILATQLANYDFNESTVEITLNVNKINREINAFNNSPLEFKFNHGDFTLEETVESNIFRDNSFTYDFEVLEEQEFIEYNTINNNFKILGVGTNIIKITRNESEYHTEATKTITVTIVQADSVFTFNDNWNINKFYTDNDFNLINYVSTNDIQDEIHPFEYTFAISSIDSNPIVAEIKNNSQIHIIDVGQSLITVTRKETLNYLPENKTTRLIIAPANPTFTGGTQQNISKTFTDKTYQIIPNTPDTNKDNSSFEYTYQTSNEKIASVNLTGLVTFNKSGNVVITVTRNSTSYFNAGTIEYNLTIGKSDSGFSISNISDNNIEKTFGDPNFTFNPINTISGNKINTGKITYQVQVIDKNVVQMKGNQMIILRSESTKINVKQESDANYIESSKEITVTINKKTPSLSDFYSNGISKKIGDKPFIIVQPKSNSLGKFTYESSDTSIATIDTNGLVNIMDLGTAKITAKQDFNVWFNEGSINTTLYIKKIPQLSDFNTIIKQIGTETFQIIPPKSDSLGNFTYFSSDSSIATINGNQITIVGAGRAFIKAVQSENLIYGSGEIYTTLIVYSSGLNLSNLNLSGANMSYLNLSGFNFENSNMYNVNLLGANLSGANLTKANLTKANLQLAKLTKLELAGADLTGVDMSLTELVGTSYKLTNRSNILPYGWYYDKKTLTMLKPLRETLSEESLYTYLNNKLNSITESNTYLKHIINNNIYSNMLPNLDNIVIPAYQNQIYDYDGLIYINPIINKDWKIEYTIPNSQIQIIIEIPQNINKLIIGIKLPSEFKLGNKKFNGRDILLSILVLPINESNQIIQNSNSNVNILINILSSSNNYTLLCSSSNPNNNVKSQIKDNNSYKFIMGSFGEFLLTDYFVFDTVW